MYHMHCLLIYLCGLKEKLDHIYFFWKRMQVQICQAVNTHKQTTGWNCCRVWAEERGEKRRPGDRRGADAACDTMWSNRDTEDYQTAKEEPLAMHLWLSLQSLSLSIGREACSVRLSLSFQPLIFSQSIIFFSHNKPANSTFSHLFSAKRTTVRWCTAVLT
jgi:hypothetical protein